MNRKRYVFKPGTREIQLGDRTLVMGVVNVTPDSFSDGGAFLDPEKACARAMELEQQGADIVDIGAESTRPGSAPVSEEEEIRRLVPVLKKLRGKLSIPVSVDTYNSAVAMRVLDLGAEIINDPTGLTFDPGLGKVVNQFDAGLILNHIRGTPETWSKLAPLQDPAATVLTDLRASIHRARKDHVGGARIIADPGLGFGKRKDENYRLIAGLGRLAAIEVPLLVGPSRKSFLGVTTPEDLFAATAAAVTASILNGAHIVRVHDAGEMRAVIQVADAMLRAAGAEYEATKPAAPAPKGRDDLPPADEGERKSGRPHRPPISRKVPGKTPEPEYRREEGPRKFDRVERADRGDRPLRRFDPEDRRPRRFDRQDRGDRGDRGAPRDGGGPQDRGGDRPAWQRPDRAGGPPRRFDRPPRQFDRPQRGSDREDRGERRPPRPYDRDGPARRGGPGRGPRRPPGPGRGGRKP
jgi:dihydropteroate synthase